MVMFSLGDVSLYQSGVIVERNELLHYRETCVNLINSLFKCDFNNITNTTLSQFSTHIFCPRCKALTSGCLCPGKKRRCPSQIHCWRRPVTLSKHTVIKIMSGKQPDTCTNALASINILQLEDTWKTMAYRSLIWRTINSRFWGNVERSLTA